VLPALLDLSAMFSTSACDRVKMERTTFNSSHKISQGRGEGQMQAFRNARMSIQKYGVGKIFLLTKAACI